MTNVTWTYAAIAYFITWSITLTSYVFFKQGSLSVHQLNLIYNLGALGPLIAAAVCAHIYYGTNGVKRLFAACNVKQLNKKSILMALSPLGFFLVGLLFYPVFTGHGFTFAETQRQFHLTTPITYINWLLPFITYSIFEEFGWRGFLLPHLQEKYTAFRSAALMTVIWACWHLPFFLWRLQFSLFISIGFFFAIYVASIIITSIYNVNRGNIFATILFHFANNIASAFDKEYIVAFVSIGFVVLAVYIIKKYGPKNLAHIPRVKNFYLHAANSTNRSK